MNSLHSPKKWLSQPATACTASCLVTAIKNIEHIPPRYINVGLAEFRRRWAPIIFSTTAMSSNRGGGVCAWIFALGQPGRFGIYGRIFVNLRTKINTRPYCGRYRCRLNANEKSNVSSQYEGDGIKWPRTAHSMSIPLLDNSFSDAEAKVYFSNSDERRRHCGIYWTPLRRISCVG